MQKPVEERSIRVHHLALQLTLRCDVAATTSVY